MSRVLHLVDSIDYVKANCFQHQLLKALAATGQVETVGLHDLKSVAGYDRVICCLKQRTVHDRLDQVASILGRMPVVAYDQDPWQAYMDDSPYKGTYQKAARKLNITAFAVTTRLWAHRIEEDMLPAMFVKMWVLPEYCDKGPVFEDRKVPVGFIGSLHPHRRRLFEQLDDLNVHVNVQGGNALSYDGYLRALSDMRVFIHSEDSKIVVDGKEENLKDALWIKDIEAAARGCFTIRNAGADAKSYYEGVETAYLYNDPKEVPDILRAIETMDPVQRQGIINRSVNFIQQSDRWQETATQLLVAG